MTGPDGGDRLSRLSPGADAICLIEVGQKIGDDLLKRVRAIPHVVQAAALSF